MKKLVIGACLILITISCDKSKKKQEGNTVKQKAGITWQRISLNGIPFDDANTMVKIFSDEPDSYSTKTTFWFSKQYVDNIDTILTKENADGLRIYLARKSGAKNNSVVIVSTMDDGTDSNGNPIHLDYYKHTAKFLSSADAQSLEEDGKDGGGATLYTNPNCPAESCNVEAINYIECDKASKWVRNFSDDDISTNSEWFGLDLINYLNAELHAAGASADGVRIYLSQNDDGDHKFIITTTSPKGAYHKDYYECHASRVRDTSLAENGEICPVRCTGTSLPSK